VAITIIIIQFFIYLRADSTAIGLLQSKHGHIQQKQWTALRQCTKNNNNNNNNNNKVILIVISIEIIADGDLTLTKHFI
jgi:hypothetical protein